jgi:hypothetical protein
MTLVLKGLSNTDLATVVFNGSDTAATRVADGGGDDKHPRGWRGQRRARRQRHPFGGSGNNAPHGGGADSLQFLGSRLGRAASAAVRRWPAHQHGRRHRERRLEHLQWGWQFSGTQGLDEAYVPFFGALGAAWDDAMVARWSADPLAVLWPELDPAFGGNGDGSPPGRPVVIIAAR